VRARFGGAVWGRRGGFAGKGSGSLVVQEGSLTLERENGVFYVDGAGGGREIATLVA